MPAVLNTNMASLYAQKNLSTAQADLATSVQRLSSGKRINSAKDDAAGYAVAEAVAATKNITDQSIRNTQDAISLVQTAEGALDVVGKILQRVLTLTTQKENGTLTTGSGSQVESIDNEITTLLGEISQINQRTRFQGNASSIFGTTQTFTTGSGSACPTQTTVNIADLSLAGLSKAASGTGAATAISGTNLNLSSGLTAKIEDNAKIFINGIDSGKRVNLPAGYAQGSTSIVVDGTYAAGFSDASFNNAVITFHKADAVSGAVGEGAVNLSATYNSGTDKTTVTFNGAETGTDPLAGYKVFKNGIDTGKTVVSFTPFSSPSGSVVISGQLSVFADDVLTFTNDSVLNKDSSSSDVMASIQTNLTNRATLGTYQTQLNYIVDNMQTLSNNLADAKSRIVDTDYAAETAALTRGQILQQAATSMLAQANQMPNVILTLLK